ncbi:hypothetical protein FXV83_41955 [Bradyrhizobium hipponense]|uniref:Uncharacterized protein n=1 Tax=Bradyrhizobium hipponense TaxID=2605638 RepID=A0A5S4Y8Q3_9BRAD|nr:hypothetical protein [Bradyrhizobium hipponense]TYO60786.1 hypothetical protein FXV83_41955 [Bradyrhizobium hipponense]
MTDTANGGLPEAAAKPVRAEGGGQDFNNMLRSGADPARIADIIENDDMPPHQRIADWIEGDDTNSGDFRAGSPRREGELGEVTAATGAPNASPRSWGFDVEEINRSYALAIWGGKAVVVNEQPSGPVNDRVRVMSFESMNSWFANLHGDRGVGWKDSARDLGKGLALAPRSPAVRWG